MALTFNKLGQYVKQVDERNRDVGSENVLGINIEKYFMPSVANTIGTDLGNYKVLRKGRFACNPMHVGRDGKLPVALYEDDEPAIVSPAYFMFEIIDENILDKDYLMLCFRRPDFDRMCWFRTDASVRAGIAWEDVCELLIPVPSLPEQQKIVHDYKVVMDRIELLKKINENLEVQAETVYSNIVNGEGFELTEISNIANLSAGGDTPDDKSDVQDAAHPIPIFSNGTDNDGLFGYTSTAKIIKPSITVSARGYIGYTVLHRTPYLPVVRLISITPNNENYLEYLYFYFKKLQYAEDGSAQQQATVPFFKTLKCIRFSDVEIKEFCEKMRPFFTQIENNKKEVVILQTLAGQILANLV